MTEPASAALLHADALAALEGWRPPHDDEAQSRLRQEYLDHLRARPDGLWRECLPAHVTASTLVLDHDAGRVLLTLHPKVGRWVQLGGHCERGDETLAGAARREAAEESGIDSLPVPVGPVQLDRHPVRCGPTRTAVHLDVQYVVVAPAGVREVVSAESTALSWWPVNRLPESADASVRSLVSRALLVVDG